MRARERFARVCSLSGPTVGGRPTDMQAALPLDELPSFLGTLRPGTAIDFGDVVVVPLFAPSRRVRVSSLEEALAGRTAKVTEVTADGRVGTLRVDNLGDVPLLLLDGEQVRGAKQDRVFNATILIPAGASVEAPVSCVERGRWRSESREMRSTESTLPPSMRASKLRSVTASLHAGGSYAGDQRQVWREVEEYATRTHTRSETMSFVQSLDARNEQIEARARALEPQPGQVGLAVVRGDAVASLDAFASEELYRRNHRKIARGIAAELEGEGRHGTSASSIVQRTLDALASVPARRTRAPGCGDTLSVAVGPYTAGAIAHEGQVLHLLATSA